jgi:hypothetical protein
MGRRRSSRSPPNPACPLDVSNRQDLPCGLVDARFGGSNRKLEPYGNLNRHTKEDIRSSLLGNRTRSDGLEHNVNDPGPGHPTLPLTPSIPFRLPFGRFPKHGVPPDQFINVAVAILPAFCRCRCSRRFPRSGSRRRPSEGVVDRRLSTRSGSGRGKVGAGSRSRSSSAAAIGSYVSDLSGGVGAAGRLSEQQQVIEQRGL